MIIVAAMFCAATFAGYTAYDNATMTEQEKFLQANLEALTDPEISPDCPNGCKEPSGTCWCYGEKNATEAEW